MSAVVSFLENNWQRFGLQRFGSPANLSTVIATPRFRASGHLLFFVLSSGKAAPFLVVKIPRIAGDNSRLDREVANLRIIQSSRTDGFASIPNVLAYEDYKDNRVLVQTALVNQPMKPTVVRGDSDGCTTRVLAWLLELHQATRTDHHDCENSFTRLMANHLDYFEATFPCTEDDLDLLARTRDLCDGLCDPRLPLVFEHGDLSSPNILMSDSREIGVVDWELAEPNGLPAVDLFFFLSYIAFARSNAKKNPRFLSAFQNGFFGPEAWAIPHIVSYREALQLAPGFLKPLFIACWSRYVVSLVTRLQEHNRSDRLCGKDAEWLRSNRYYAMWQYAVMHADKIAFG